MATRGNKGDPHWLKVIKGSAKDGWTQRNVPPEPPPMSDDAREFWDYYAPRLAAAGIITELDRDTLHHLCEFGALCRRALADLTDAPLEVGNGRGGSKKNPLFLIARDCVTSFRLLAADLGLTPTARARLNIVEPPEISELDRLLGYDDED